MVKQLSVLQKVLLTSPSYVCAPGIPSTAQCLSVLPSCVIPGIVQDLSQNPFSLQEWPLDQQVPSVPFLFVCPPLTF